jgi:hypothetical protein
MGTPETGINDALIRRSNKVNTNIARLRMEMAKLEGLAEQMVGCLAIVKGLLTSASIELNSIENGGN